MVVDTRLLALVPGARGHVLRAALWLWAAALGQALVACGICHEAALVISGVVTFDAAALGEVALGCVLLAVASRLAAKERFRSGKDVRLALREQLFEKLLRLGVPGTQDLSSAEVVQLAVDGCERLEAYLSECLPQLLAMVVVPLTLFAFLAPACLSAALVLLACAALAPLVLALRARSLRGSLTSYWDNYSGLADEFLESLRGLTTLKIYQADAARQERMRFDARHLGAEQLQAQASRLRGALVIDVLSLGGAVAASALALSQLAAGACDLASVLLVFLLATGFLAPARQVSATLSDTLLGLSAADRAFALLDLQEVPVGGAERAEPGDHLSMNDVSFGFEPGRDVVSHVTLDVPAVGLTAIVGESGSGKTTTARLLMGELSDYRGVIYLGGRSLSNFSRPSLARYVTVVTSHSRIFGGSVRDNLRMGDPFASDDEMWAVLDSVSLGGFLRAREGLDTACGDGGRKLSGGQRQRLALARALLHNSPVYIFDEATSNVDVVSEDAIMAAIRGIARYKAVVVITHRLANVRAAGRIYVLEDGRVAGVGTHEELLDSCPAYQALWKSQRDLESYAAHPLAPAGTQGSNTQRAGRRAGAVMPDSAERQPGTQGPDGSEGAVSAHAES